MAFDGARALAVGDYVTPSEGEYAGQLGPWADLVRGLGLEPRSTPVKAFVMLAGAAALAAAAAVALGWRPFAAGVAGAAAVAWHLPAGTLVAALALALLLWARRRPAAGGL